jgi:EAL domain-containing protein (putative c-di-GMP-specific phosphodiesterase class I)
VHAAKAIPGLAVCMADPRFERGSGASLMAEQGLRAGLRNEEFVLAFQPKRSARDGRLTGFEALVRWQRPGAGLVSPADFIPAAERTGLIGPLGALILDKACAQVAAWQRAGVAGVPVAVNVSPLQLLDAGFAALVGRTLARHGVSPDALAIEITESAAVAHLDDARQRIQELRALGLEVALDDFGAGISSLNILRSLPLQGVKLDRLLIDPLPAPDALAVVRAVCQLASALGMTVVAEGVETAAQADAARQAGCDELQGYHFGRPLPPADAEACMRRAMAGADGVAAAQPPGGTTDAMPALAICASSLDLTPLTPTAPTR